MLYITTKGKYDAFTAPKALSSDRGSDGGLYLPFQLPKLEREQIASLGEKSFGQNVADILNQFFSCRLNGLDVELCIGRYPVRMQSVGHRTLIAETWRNLQWDYVWLEKSLVELVCGRVGTAVLGTSWLKIAIRIAVLFGIFGELQRDKMLNLEETVDVSVPAGDFSVPMSVWYGREMGLPIGKIICCCNDNSGSWELLQHGEVRTDMPVVNTQTPLADIPVPPEMERLICACLGQDEAIRFCETSEKGSMYALRPDMLETLRQGMYPTVVSNVRLGALIPSVYRTSGYVLGAYTALAYGGLMDYRAKNGRSRQTLILSERSPVCDADVVTGIMGISLPELQKLVGVS